MHDLVDRLHYVGPLLVKVNQLADSFMQPLVIPVNAVVHDAIQIQVQVVYTGTSLVSINQISKRPKGHTQLDGLSPWEVAWQSTYQLGAFLFTNDVFKDDWVSAGGPPENLGIPIVSLFNDY